MLFTLSGFKNLRGNAVAHRESQEIPGSILMGGIVLSSLVRHFIFTA